MATFKAGDKFEDYVILEYITSGGIAEIYRIISLETRKEAILKLFLTQFLNSTLVQACMRGIDIAKKLSGNKYFPEVYSSGSFNNVFDTSSNETGTVYPYVIMEYINGREFRRIFKADYTVAAGSLTLEHALKVMHSCASACETMHCQSVVHGDIKLRNLMMDSDNRIVVLDFDFAFEGKRMQSTGREILVNPNGKTSCGTQLYMAPELYDLNLGEGHTQYSDVWALGCVFYVILTGGLHFKYYGNLDSFKRKVLYDPLALDVISKIDNSVSELIHPCFEKKWYNRPDSTQLRKGLESLMVQKGIEVTTTCYQAQPL